VLLRREVVCVSLHLRHFISQRVPGEECGRVQGSCRGPGSTGEEGPAGGGPLLDRVDHFERAGGHLEDDCGHPLRDCGHP
jgi:hypothetical protein